MNILIFSGYTLEELKAFNSEGINELLVLTDTLIDGVFLKDQFDNELVRGSKNQRIHHLGDKRLSGRDFARNGRELILHPVSGERTSTGVRRRDTL